MPDIAFLHGFAVAVKLLVSDLNHIARYADNALDVIHALIAGELEDDDIPALRIFTPEKVFIGEGNLHPVNKLVHQQVIANLNGIQHGT